MDDVSQSAGEAEPRVPEGLARDLARLHGGGEELRMPAEVDEHVRMLARHRLAAERTAEDAGAMSRAIGDRGESRRRRTASSRWIAMSGAAAVLALTGVLVLPRLGGPGPGGTAGRGGSGALSLEAVKKSGGLGLAESPAAGREDINGDGAVDILDAQRLVHVLRTGAAGPRGAGEAPPVEWDVNGDGVVDEGDAKAIARHVVEVKRNGGAG